MTTDYLFIDTISPVASFIIHDNEWSIKSQKSKIIKWNEYNSLGDEIFEFITENNIKINELNWITAVNWPGSFTGTRIVALVCNTINFTYKIPLDFLDYFELLEKSWLPYPYIIKANRWEYLIKTSQQDKSTIRPLNEINEWDYVWIWDINDFENKQIWIIWLHKYEKFIKNYRFKNQNKRMEPLYIKKPNIT